ncbi:MAG: hypothetical protein LBC97_04325 [Bifidobacteriaceae bacterium]|nr:hypothetical protein [Bifidobacteriaceae bacterium]
MTAQRSDQIPREEDGDLARAADKKLRNPGGSANATITAICRRHLPECGGFCAGASVEWQMLSHPLR